MGLIVPFLFLQTSDIDFPFPPVHIVLFWFQTEIQQKMSIIISFWLVSVCVVVSVWREAGEAGGGRRMKHRKEELHTKVK